MPLLALLLTTPVAHAACTAAPELAHRAELSFGADRDGHPYVSARRWRAFLAEVLTPAFPGFTVLDGTGYWKGAAEPTRIVVILHAASDDPALLAVADAYRVRFGQEATLVADAPVTTTLCSGS